MHGFGNQEGQELGVLNYASHVMGLNEKNKLKDNQSIAIKLDSPNPITFRNHHAKSSGTIKIYYLFINTESRLTLYCLIKKTFHVSSSTSLDDDMEMITMSSSYPSLVAVLIFIT